MSVIVVSEIKATDDESWASIKAKIAEVDAHYSIDEANKTARLRFDAKWTGHGVEDLIMQRIA